MHHSKYLSIIVLKRSENSENFHLRRKHENTILRFQTCYSVNFRSQRLSRQIHGQHSHSFRVGHRWSTNTNSDYRHTVKRNLFDPPNAITMRSIAKVNNFWLKFDSNRIPLKSFTTPSLVMHKPVQTYIYAPCITLIIRCGTMAWGHCCVYFVSNQMKIEQTLPVVFIIIYYQYWDHPNSIAPLRPMYWGRTIHRIPFMDFVHHLRFGL